MKTDSRYVETPKIGFMEKLGFGTFSTASNVVFNFVARSDLCVYSGDDFYDGMEAGTNKKMENTQIPMQNFESAEE